VVATPLTPAAAAAPASAASADPDRYQALMAEGKKRYAKGQWKAAQTAYTAALQLDPSRTDALVPLARCQLDSGALDDALGNARRAIAKRGDDADAWLVIGAVEQQRSHSREARAAYQKYLALAPNAAYAGDVRAVLRTLH
jgi:tetratricopeptide (TPR) repeat protein